MKQQQGHREMPLQLRTAPEQTLRLKGPLNMKHTHTESTFINGRMSRFGNIRFMRMTHMFSEKTEIKYKYVNMQKTYLETFYPGI